MKICPKCGKENRDKSFCTGCGFDISNVETVEDRTKREEKEKQEDFERINNEQKEKQLEIQRKEREQKEKQEELERKEREQKRKEAEIERKEREEKLKMKSKQKSRLKIIGVLIIIIVVLCAGLYFAINQNNTQAISDIDVSKENSSNVETPVSEVNNNNAGFNTVDFNGLFKMDLPVECDFSELPGNSNVGADYTWQNWNSQMYYDSIYYFESYNDLNDVLSKFSISSYEIEGDLLLFDDFDGNIYAGVQSSDNRFVLLKASNINELDNLKQSANSVVFE